MRRGRVLGLLALVLLLGGSCADDAVQSQSMSSGTSAGVEELRPRAAQVTDQLAANEFGSVRDMFDENMANKLAEDGLANAWKSVLAAKGAYKSRGEPTQVASPAGQDIYAFDTPVEFENGPMKTRLAFHPDGRIAGLFILNPDVP